MKTKICTQCHKKKSINEFYNDNRLYDGKMSACKECHGRFGKTEKSKKKRNEWYIKNKKRLLKRMTITNRIYRKIKKPWFVSFDKAHQRCTNPKQQHYKYYGGRGIKFLMTLDDFEFLWKRDNASQMKRPSIDRIDSDGNYELSNCRFIELKDNCGRNKKKILQFDLNNIFIKEWDSIKSIAIHYKVNPSTISHALKNKSKKYKGYIWNIK